MLSGCLTKDICDFNTTVSNFSNSNVTEDTACRTNVFCPDVCEFRGHNKIRVLEGIPVSKRRLSPRPENGVL
jgi:hypothetical protein